MIDISGIDANLKLAGDQAFTFIGTEAFGGAAGELRYEVTAEGVVVRADADGDGGADLSLLLTGCTMVTAGDFDL